MARRGKRDGRRDVSTDLTIPSLTWSPPVVRTIPRIVRVPSRSRLILIEDRRTWTPEASLVPSQTAIYRRTPLKKVSGVPTYRLKVKPSPRRSIPPGIQFADQQRLVLCIRRKQRKQVLHALRKVGKGQKHRNPKRNFWSSISC